MADAVTDAAELCRLLRLPLGTAAAASDPTEGFPLLVPRTFLSRIHPGDLDDPLLLQILPRRDELEETPGFTADPVGEATSTRDAAWLWKYPGRLLMVTNAGCSVHCRFCFRRHFRYLPAGCWGSWEPALKQVETEPSIREVIFSGGDPLALEDHVLADLAKRLASIPHVRRLRVHTRFPVVVPQRVTEELLGWLRGSRLTTVVVVHVNHPAEIDADVAAALARLVDAGVPVLSQTVLLRGVNDRVETLAELFECLVDLRVIPYYLHQLDRVAGAAHFEVPVAEGAKLIQELRDRLPGYAVPRYVREVPDLSSKLALG